MRRVVLRAVVALGMLAASSIAVAGCHKKPVAEPVAIEPPAGQVWLTPQQVTDGKITFGPVAEHDVDDTILTSGRVTFDDLRVGHVFSPVTGRVVRIAANPGDRVKKGAPLAVIESPDIGNAVSDVHKAEADVIAAEHDFKRKKDLFEKHATSLADLEMSEDSYRKAKAEVERARAKAFLLRAGGINAGSQTYTLVAPIDGEVIMRDVNPGIEVAGQYGGGAAKELFTVGELDRVWVFADLYEMDLARVKVGSKVVVKIVAYKDKVFEGRVDWVSGMLDATSRTVKVRCTLENPDKLLKPEMYATVQLSVEERRAMAIPRQSILRLGDSTIVFLQVGETDGKVRFERVPVTVDEGESSNWLVVQHGLELGQNIVTSGAILLSAKL